MGDSPFAHVSKDEEGPSPSDATRPAILEVLAQSAQYLRERGNDPAMVSIVITLMGQLELTLQALYAAGITVPVLIHIPKKEDQ